ncbi:uncharacterized protein [Phyllobates terribilis]|uniref:uncharacterized protein n=1 Tax=Phyllobates terribilis TaxID=111132 RepID=UPI003CCA79C2
MVAHLVAKVCFEPDYNVSFAASFSISRLLAYFPFHKTIFYALPFFIPFDLGRASSSSSASPSSFPASLHRLVSSSSSSPSSFPASLNRCIPFRYRNSTYCNGASGEQIVEVLMITSASEPGLLFPKGGSEDDETLQQAVVSEAMEEAGVKGDLMGSLGVYDFKSRTLQDEYCPSGLCKAEMWWLLNQ